MANLIIQLAVDRSVIIKHFKTFLLGMN